MELFLDALAAVAIPFVGGAAAVLLAQRVPRWAPLSAGVGVALAWIHLGGWPRTVQGAWAWSWLALGGAAVLACLPASVTVARRRWLRMGLLVASALYAWGLAAPRRTYAWSAGTALLWELVATSGLTATVLLWDAAFGGRRSRSWPLLAGALLQATGAALAVMAHSALLGQALGAVAAALGGAWLAALRQPPTGSSRWALAAGFLSGALLLITAWFADLPLVLLLLAWSAPVGPLLATRWGLGARGAVAVTAGVALLLVGLALSLLGVPGV